MFRSFSLTSRLTIFFTMAAAAIVLGLGVLFMVLTAQHFVDLDRSSLQDKQHLIEEILTTANSTDDARWRLGEALGNHHDLYASVESRQGGIIFRSHEFQPPTPSSVVDPVSSSSTLQDWSDRGREFRSLRFQTHLANVTSDRLDVLVAIDTAHHSHFMAQLRHTLAFYAVLAVGVSGLLGWFAAYKGLTPLRAMKARASVVTGQQLGQRMPVDAVPIEMADLARELNQMLDRLQDDFRRLSEFSSDLAHELRTPISNLLTQTQVAMSAQRDAQTYHGILESNAEEFQRLARMVSDMLFLAKTERGVDLPHKEKFSAAQDAQALLEFYEAVAEEKGITLGLHGDGAILGDRLMFRRALSNLLSNALRHAHHQGTVVVKVGETVEGTLVAVENSGDRIDPAVLPRLFDRFYRADPSRAHPESEGAGLGLPITRAIVQAHGGTVDAQSQDGVTVFRMLFPRQNERPETEAGTSPRTYSRPPP